MAFKPYKVQKSQDIYAKYDKKKQQRNVPDRGSVKLFGFRSGLAYKMIPAILYYAFMLFYIGIGIYGEIKYYEFEPMDIVLMILKYIFFFVWFFSPAIFLSDFKYRDSLPFFKKRNAGSSLIGLIIVSMFCSFMTYVYKDCMSDTYKASVEAYAKVLEDQQKENETTQIINSVETTTVVSTDEETEYVDVGNGDNYAYDIFSDETETDNNKAKKSEDKKNNGSNKSDTKNIDPSEDDTNIVNKKEESTKSNSETQKDDANSDSDGAWTDFY